MQINLFYHCSIVPFYILRDLMTSTDVEKKKWEKQKSEAKKHRFQFNLKPHYIQLLLLLIELEFIEHKKYRDEALIKAENWIRSHHKRCVSIRDLSAYLSSFLIINCL